MTIEYATEADIPQLHQLIQLCYRGEFSKKGWTSEADILGGIRTTPEIVQEEMNAPGAQFFKYTDEEGKLTGCVYTQVFPADKKTYVGMLCVHPDKQAKGLGRKLMETTEKHAQEKGCTKMCMKVISRRTELTAWYERLGYTNTGEVSPFFTDEGHVFGEPKVPLEFNTLEKPL